MPKVLLIHGAGMNMRGKTQIEIFGPMTLPEYDQHIRRYASELGLEAEIFHSNIEGEVINKLYSAHDAGADAAIINPAGYTTGHPALAAAIAQVARDAINVAGKRARGGAPMAEHELQKWILDRFAEQKLFCDHGPIVAAGANAANPHYEPSAAAPRRIERGDILLVDLWAREPAGPGVYADQTWMASLGPPSARASDASASRRKSLHHKYFLQPEGEPAGARTQNCGSPQHG